MMESLGGGKVDTTTRWREGVLYSGGKAAEPRKSEA